MIDVLVCVCVWELVRMCLGAHGTSGGVGGVRSHAAYGGQVSIACMLHEVYEVYVGAHSDILFTRAAYTTVAYRPRRVRRQVGGGGGGSTSKCAPCRCVAELFAPCRL